MPIVTCRQCRIGRAEAMSGRRNIYCAPCYIYEQRRSFPKILRPYTKLGTSGGVSRFMAELLFQAFVEHYVRSALQDARIKYQAWYFTKVEPNASRNLRLVR